MGQGEAMERQGGAVGDGRPDEGDRFEFRWPEPSNRIARTWRVNPGLARHINATAEELLVFPSDLVCYLLSKALDQVAAGQLVIPTRPAHRYVIVDDDSER